MEYEVIRVLTQKQLDKIYSESRRELDPDLLFMVKENGVEIGFGYIFIINGRLTIEYSLFKEFQHQGHGAMFVNMLSDAIGDKCRDYDTMYLLIHKDNTPSIKVALKNGYKMECYDWEFRDMVNGDMPEQYIFSKANKYYKERKLNKIPLNQV